MKSIIMAAVVLVVIVVAIAAIYSLTTAHNSAKTSSTINQSTSYTSKPTTIVQTTIQNSSTTTILQNNSKINNPLSPNPITADWHGNVTTYVQGNYLVVHTNDVPPIAGNFPDAADPNKIEVQNYTFYIPLHPQNASHTVPVPSGGQIGIALNGVLIFGPLDANGNNAVIVEGKSFDQCNGHPQKYGVYHYHEFSPCIVNSTPGEHSPLLGFAFDGYPIYGPDGANGIPISQNSLDSCNGHYDPMVGSYVYVATNSYPYYLGCYRGTPVPSDLPSATGP